MLHYGYTLVNGYHIGDDTSIDLINLFKCLILMHIVSYVCMAAHFLNKNHHSYAAVGINIQYISWPHVYIPIHLTTILHIAGCRIKLVILCS